MHHGETSGKLGQRGFRKIALILFASKFKKEVDRNTFRGKIVMLNKILMFYRCNGENYRGNDNCYRGYGEESSGNNNISRNNANYYRSNGKIEVNVCVEKV